MAHVDREGRLLDRIVVEPDIFGGKPVIRGRRLAVEHVLAMLAAGDDEETILEGYRWLKPDDIRACLLFAHLDRERDWERDREWRQEVEPEDNEMAFEAGANDEPCREWKVFAEQNYDSEEDIEPNYDSEEYIEPNYDSEEDMRTMAM